MSVESIPVDNQREFRSKQLHFTVESYLKKNKHTRLALAFSGGLDSTVLLHLIVSYLPKSRIQRFRVLHINHQLHPQANKWMRACKERAAKLNVPFNSISIDVAEGNLESKAREARYKALFEALEPEERLITAHHATDQAETILLHAFRQSGFRGMRGMFNDRNIDRPLLHIPQSYLEYFAFEQKLSYIDDPMNQDQQYSRVFIRSNILPRLRMHWNNADYRLMQTSLQIQECWSQQQELINRYIQRKKLTVSMLKSFSSSTQSLLLTEWLRKEGFHPPSKSQINEFVRQLASAGDRHPSLRIGNKAYLYRFRETVECIRVPDPCKTLQWNPLNGPLSLSSGRHLEFRSKHTCDETFTVHWRHTLNTTLVSKKWLKRKWQIWSIAPILRDHIPFIFRKSLLICVPGYYENDSIPQHFKKSFVIVDEDC